MVVSIGQIVLVQEKNSVRPSSTRNERIGWGLQWDITDRHLFGFDFPRHTSSSTLLSLVTCLALASVR